MHSLQEFAQCMREVKTRHCSLARHNCICFVSFASICLAVCANSPQNTLTQPAHVVILLRLLAQQLYMLVVNACWHS